MTRDSGSPLTALGYIGTRADELDTWKDFATGLLGLQVVDQTRTTTALRMDDRRQRMLISTDEPDERFFGWEAVDATGISVIAARLDARGIPYVPMSASLAGRRLVADGLVFRDPAGNRIEVFHGAATTDEPFRPGRQHSGFRTGGLGLGHAVLTAPDLPGLAAFYEDVLGFRLSDHCAEPFRASFYHLNPRHHSLAIVETATVGVHHIMIEMLSLDDVGQALDIAETRDVVGVTLGRHSNDHMVSFYARSPAGFMVECGWGGRTIDPDSWVSEELTNGPSLWGHERHWLPVESRAIARQMRMDAAARGVRAPAHVSVPFFDVADDCSWWASRRPSPTSVRRGAS